MSRYAILEHDHPELHWDLLLEAGDVLLAWRLAAPPRDAAPVAATRIADHRRIYLDYEGPVSGDRGRVRAWDRGTFALTGLEAEGCLWLRLRGHVLNADALLRRREGAAWVFQLVEAGGVSSPAAPAPAADN